MESCHGCVTGVEIFRCSCFKGWVLYGVVNLRLADSEFLIIFGMKRRWRGRDVFECHEVLLVGNVCVFFVLGRYRKRHLGWASAVGATQVGGLEQTL